MPFTPPPGTPNFKFGVGRLATDRYDFEAHLEGTNPPNATNFRHNATQIDMKPILTINSVSPTTVQDAINQLNTLVNTLTPPIATHTVYGSVKLDGDLYGNGSTAATPRVGGLQGRTVTNASPSPQDVLTWSGSSWGPVTLTLGNTGDVQGAFTTNKVTSITSASPVSVSSNINLISSATLTAQNGTTIAVASGGTIVAQNNSLIDVLSGAALTMESGSQLNMSTGSHVYAPAGFAFTTTSGVIIKQDTQTSDTGCGDIQLKAQGAYSGATGTNRNGGFLYLYSGQASAGGKSGNICLQTNNPGLPVWAVIATPISVSLFPDTNLPPDVGSFAKTAQTNYNWSNAPFQSVNTQFRSCTNYQVCVSTTTTAHLQASPTFTLPGGGSSTNGAVIEVRWVRRNTSTNETGGGMSWFAVDTGTGLTGGNVYHSGLALSGDIIGQYSSGQFYLQVVGPGAAPWDWQLIININLI